MQFRPTARMHYPIPTQMEMSEPSGAWGWLGGQGRNGALVKHAHLLTQKPSLEQMQEFIRHTHMCLISAVNIAGTFSLGVSSSLNTIRQSLVCPVS